MDAVTLLHAYIPSRQKYAEAKLSPLDLRHQPSRRVSTRAESLGGEKRL